MRRGGPIRSRSPRRAAEERAYRRLRLAFLEANPYCEFPEPCGEQATEVHHKRGRVGADLLDVDHWAGLCSPHHRFATEHPAAAYEMGISERRIGRTA